MVFEKEYIMRCSSPDWIARDGMPLDDVIVVLAGKLRELWDSLSKKCAVFCVGDNWKGQFWGLRYCLSKLRSWRVSFQSGMTSHSKIAQLNWQCEGRLTPTHGLCHPISHSQSEHEICINCLSVSGGRRFPRLLPVCNGHCSRSSQFWKTCVLW